MARSLQNKEVNLWPAAVLTLAIFMLLISIGLIVTFGVVQQLRYIAWEQKLRQTEQSLAAERQLFDLTQDFKKSIENYNTQGMPISLETAQQRFNLIIRTLPSNPETVKNNLTDWSTYNLGPEFNSYTEQKTQHTFTITSQLAQINNYYSYQVTAMQSESLILYSQNQYLPDQTITINAFKIDQNLVE